MNVFISIIENLTKENRFRISSSIFRVYICVHLLKDLYYSWDFIPILYTNSHFYKLSSVHFLEFFGVDPEIIRSNINIFIAIYLLLILFFLVGFGRFLTVFLLYICFEISQRLCHVVLNGGDNLMKFCLIYMILINSYNHLSIFKKSFFKNSEKISNFFSNLGGYSICFHLCLAYFFSAFHKIHTDIWYNGIATYYTLSLERFMGTPYNLELAKNGLFVTISTYATLFIELCYPFLVWIKQTKKYIIILAILMHLSIYYFMMIYDFQLVFIFVQLFFLPNEFYQKMYHKFKRYRWVEKLSFVYSNTVLNKKGIK